MRLPLAVAALAGVLLATPSSSGPNHHQRQQIAFLMAYGTDKDHDAPTFNEAWAVVQTHPKVMTIAQWKALRLSAKSSGGPATSASRPPHIPLGSGRFTKTPAQFSVSWGRGWTSWSLEYGFNETLGWKYNASRNWIGNQYVRGYPWVAAWASVLWHADGQYHETGYPYWQFGGGGTNKKGQTLTRWVAYWNIEQFKWGYGPVSGEAYLRFWEAGYATGFGEYGSF